MPEPAGSLTGTQHEIAAGDYRATITELGANLRQLRYRDEPLIREYDPDDLPPAGAGELLVPWPNRIDHGRYAFGGQEYQLDLSEPANGNAIHGLTRWATWGLVAAADNRVELGYRLLGRPGYPFRLELRAAYQVTGDGLEVTISAHNAGRRPAPYGTGSHPYLRPADGLVDQWRLRLPAAQWLPADSRGIPSAGPQDVAGTEYDFRAGRQIGATSLDHALTGLARDTDGRAWATLTSDHAEVSLWAGPGYDWLQVFTGDPLGQDMRRLALAIEPMTCPPNAFVTGMNLITLAPGEAATHRWGVQASRS
jgi:aldose 1-epimerase